MSEVLLKIHELSIIWEGAKVDVKVFTIGLLIGIPVALCLLSIEIKPKRRRRWNFMKLTGWKYR